MRVGQVENKGFLGFVGSAFGLVSGVAAMMVMVAKFHIGAFPAILMPFGGLALGMGAGFSIEAIIQRVSQHRKLQENRRAAYTPEKEL